MNVIIFTVLCEVLAYITDLVTLCCLLLTFAFVTVDMNHFNVVSGMCAFIIRTSVCVSGCHGYCHSLMRPLRMET